MLTVTFPVHERPATIASILTGIGAYGNVSPTASDRTYQIYVFRPSNLPKLKARLTELERLGALRWSEV